MRKTIIVFILISSVTNLMAKEKVVYKYKEYEKFDLGDMEIKGSVIAPGDLSVRERRRKIFQRNLLERKDFDQLIIKDIKYLR